MLAFSAALSDAGSRNILDERPKLVRAALREAAAIDGNDSNRSYMASIRNRGDSIVRLMIYRRLNAGLPPIRMSRRSQSRGQQRALSEKRRVGRQGGGVRWCDRQWLCLGSKVLWH
jgi:hypothetical protein